MLTVRTCVEDHDTATVTYLKTGTCQHEGPARG